MTLLETIKQREEEIELFASNLDKNNQIFDGSRGMCSLCGIKPDKLVDFNKQTTILILKGVIERLEGEKKTGEFNLQVSPVHHLGFDVAPIHNNALDQQIDYYKDLLTTLEI